MRSDSLKRAQAKYRAKPEVREREKQSMRPYYIKCNVVADADIIAELDSQESITAYVKRLIRNDIKGRG